MPHAQPILLDSETVTISQLGGTGLISVSWLDNDGVQFSVEWRIEFESAAPLATGVFTRGGVDDVILTVTAVPEPNTLALVALSISDLGLSCRRWEA